MSYAALVVGIVVLAASVAAWRGRWRGWTRSFFTAYVPVPLTILPALGGLMLAFGIHLEVPFTGSSILVGAALAGALVAPVLALWNPPWFGPAWFRQLKASGKPIEPNLSDPLTAATYALARSDVDARAPVAKRFGHTRPLARWRVSLRHERVKIGGHLELHPSNIAFYPNQLEARMRKEPFALIIEIQEVSAVNAASGAPISTLEVETNGGEVHRLDAFFPRRIARRIAAAQRDKASG